MLFKSSASEAFERSMALSIVLLKGCIKRSKKLEVVSTSVISIYEKQWRATIIRAFLQDLPFQSSVPRNRTAVSSHDPSVLLNATSDPGF